MLHYKLQFLNALRKMGFSIPFTLFFAFAGCSIVDPAPTTTSPELDVRNYYLQLTSSNVEYNYAVTSTVPIYYPASGSLAMDMHGLADTVNSMPVYSCLWTYQNFGTPTLWYYGLTDKQAINFGVESWPGNYADSWVDLQSPLQDSASWTFTSHNEPITATVVKYGASAQVNGKTYSDVVMVQYAGTKGTTGTGWFARGTGIIYSNIVRDSEMVENQLQSVIQK